MLWVIKIIFTLALLLLAGCKKPVEEEIISEVDNG